MAELADFLKVKRGRAQQIVAAGMVPSFRLGRRIFIPRRAIEQMAEDAIARWQDGGDA